MNRAFHALNGGGWRSLSAEETGSGYVVRENSDRFARERVFEAVALSFGLLIMAGGFAIWILPLAGTFGSVWSQNVLGAGFLATGLGLYVFATCGFRRELQFRADARQLNVARLNSRAHARFRRTLHMDEIASLFVRRREDRHGMAQLWARMRGTRRKVLLMRGARADIETLHRALCADCHDIEQPKPGQGDDPSAGSSEPQTPDERGRKQRSKLFRKTKIRPRRVSAKRRLKAAAA